MSRTPRALAILLLASASGLACTAGWTQTAPAEMTARTAAAPEAADIGESSSSDAPSGPPSHPTLHRLIGDIKDYYTAPLHWDADNWALFGGSLGAIAVAHQFDRDVRTHFVAGKSGIGGSSSDLQDALPAAALFLGTYLYSSEHDDANGLTVSWAMLEAGGLSTVTSYALKVAAGRQRPNETTDPNHWERSRFGSSFPSEHAVAAFAIGTVFAESGSGGYRWITRIIGYGVAGFTGYQRLKHNAHWLSDVVAGAALGASTGLFVVDRTYGRDLQSSLSVAPIDGGLMLAYRRSLP